MGRNQLLWVIAAVLAGTILVWSLSGSVAADGPTIDTDDSVTTGDIIEIDIETDDSVSTVNITGGNYSLTAVPEEGTLQFNTYLAGSDHPDRVTGGNITAETDHEGIPTPANFTITATTAAGNTTATVDVEPRSPLRNVSTYRAPAGTLDTIDLIDLEASDGFESTDMLVEEEILLLDIEATGLEGVFAPVDDTTDPLVFLEENGVVEVELADGEQNTVIDFSDARISAYDPDADRLRVAVAVDNDRLEVGDRFGSPTTFAPDSQLTAALDLTDARLLGEAGAPYTPADHDTSIETQDDSIDLVAEQTAIDPRELEPLPTDARIDIETNRAPGTADTLVIESTDSQYSFLQQHDITIDATGTATTTADFGAFAKPGDQFQVYTEGPLSPHPVNGTVQELTLGEADTFEPTIASLDAPTEVNTTASYDVTVGLANEGTGSGVANLTITAGNQTYSEPVGLNPETSTTETASFSAPANATTVAVNVDYDGTDTSTSLSVVEPLVEDPSADDPDEDGEDDAIPGFSFIAAVFAALLGVLAVSLWRSRPGP